MLFTVSLRFLDSPTPEELFVEELIYDALPYAFSEPASGLSILCMHRSIPGEHVESANCWCEPEELIFGVQPFLAEA